MEFEKFTKIKPGKLPKKLLTEIRKEEASKSNFEVIKDKLLDYLKKHKKNTPFNEIEKAITEDLLDQLDFEKQNKKTKEIRDLLTSIDEVIKEKETEKEKTENENKIND